MNLSYCRFENTANDLADCVAALENYRDECDDLSTYEMQAAQHMYRLCQQYIDNYQYAAGKDGCKILSLDR